MLLQSLLEGRGDTAVVYHKSTMRCSCGDIYKDLGELENHLVKKHPRVTLSHQGTDEMGRLVEECVSSLKRGIETVREQEEMRAAGGNQMQAHGQKDFVHHQPKPNTKFREILPRPGPDQPCAKRKKENNLVKLCPDSLDVVVTDDNQRQQNYKRVQIPPKTFIVIIEDEDQIIACNESLGLKGERCMECHEPCEDFISLKDHYLDRHPWLWGPSYQSSQEPLLIRGKKPRGRLAGWSYIYFCPIPGCGHHVLSDRNTKSRPLHSSPAFPNKHQLAQHYVKVHAHRDRRCQRCSKKFPTEVLLNRHSRHCESAGMLSCYTCPSTFKDPESLQSHCRRKHNSTVSFVIQPNPSVSAGIGAVTASVSDGVVVTNYALSQIGAGPAAAVVTSSSVSSSRTCPGQLSAALAMAELSSNAVGIGSVLQVESSHKPLRRTHTSSGSEDRMLSSATKTREFGTSTATRAPKLGEIEQLSTETQTDELDALLVAGGGGGKGVSQQPPATPALVPPQSHQHHQHHQGHQEEDDDDPFNPSIDADAMLDILCSNYTQTCAELEENAMMLLPPSAIVDETPEPPDSGMSGMMAAAAAASGSYSSVGTHTDLGRPATSRAWHTTTNTETQTRSDDLFG